MMMRTSLAALALALMAAALVAPALAQVPVNPASISVTVENRLKPINATAPTLLNVTVTASCALVAAAASPPSTSLMAHMETTDTKDLKIEEAADAVFNPADCPTAFAGAGFTINGVGQIKVTPLGTAPGLVDLQFNVSARIEPAGQANSAQTSAPALGRVQVAYRAGHTIKPDITFPAKVTGDHLSFNVTLVYSGNARSMIMFNDVTADNGRIEGLAPRIDNPPVTVKIPVTYYAPSSSWSTANVTMYTYSHYLSTGGVSGDPALPANLKWTFENANPGGAPSASSSEKSSAPVAPMLGLLLVGLAFVVSRRKA